jgi:N-glycosylase/DNA lyase
MNKTYIGEFDIETTLMGGQAFNWIYNEGFYYGSTQLGVIKVKYQDGELVWQTYPENDDYELIKRYFKLDSDYEKILGIINKDEHMRVAINTYPGLRLLEQDFEQTLISYIISANNNIKKIRLSTKLLSEMIGNKLIVDDIKMYTFPKMENIADLSLERLRESKVGYRAPYILKSSKLILEMGITEKIHGLELSEARNILMTLSGVGPKVADCILVYSLAFEEITPFDIWAKRFISQYYGINEKSKYNEMRDWAIEYFEGYAGWGGQFLFEYIRKNYQK